MQRPPRIAGTLILLGILLPASARGQLPAIPPVVLSLPASTRALGMGDAYVALTGDPDLIFYNPAQLTAARGIGIGAHRFGDATTHVALSAVANLAPGGIGIGVLFLDQATSAASYASMAAGGESALLDRGGALATGAVAMVGYGRTIKGIRLGVAGKAILQEMANERDATLAADVGVARGSMFQVALVGQNLGPGIRLDDARVALPHRVTLGAGAPRLEVGPLDVAAGLSASYLKDGSFGGSAGAELSYMPLDGFTFNGRFGVRSFEEDGTRPTLGAGFTGERFSIDYAFHPIGGDGSGHRIGVRWR